METFPTLGRHGFSFSLSLLVVGKLLTDQHPGKKWGQWWLLVTSCRRDSVLSLWMNGRLGLLRWRWLGSKLSSVTSENIIWVRCGHSCWATGLKEQEAVGSNLTHPFRCLLQSLGTRSWGLLFLSLYWT